MPLTHSHRPALGVSLAVLFLASTGAHAAIDSNCTLVSQGDVVSMASGQACVATPHLSLAISGTFNPYSRPKDLYVDHASADSLTLSYSPSDIGDRFGGSGQSQSGMVSFGYVGRIQVADGYVVDLRAMTATITAEIYGPATFGDYSGQTGVSKNFTFEKSATMGGPGDSSSDFGPVKLNYYAPYASGPNGTALVYSTVSFSVDKIVYTVSVVPEPSSWALMVLGLGALGVVARRRA